VHARLMFLVAGFCFCPATNQGSHVIAGCEAANL